MLRFYLFSTFMIFFLIGCNSEQAQMRRIETYLAPKMIQLGTASRLFEGGNEKLDQCVGIAYHTKTESTYCVGNTQSYFAEPRGGNRDAIIVKFNRKLKIEWAKQFGQFSRQTSNTGNEAFYDIQVDQAGFLYVVGYFNDQSYLFKMNAEGNILWQKELQGRCSRVRIQDGIYCAGFIGDPIDAFVAKWSFDGERIWEKTLSDTEFPVSDSSKADSCSGLAISASGIVACAGNTLGRLTSAYSPNTDRTDGFIWLLNSHDGSFRQVIQIGTQIYTEEANTVEFDSKGNLFLAGNFQGSNKSPATPDDDFNPTELNSGTRHTFFIKFKSDGVNYNQEITRNTNIAGQTKPQRLLRIDDSKFLVCIDTFGSLFEPRAEVSTRDVALGLLKTIDLNFEKGLQFGSNTRGSFSNIGNQICNGLTRDVFGNFLVGGMTDGSTQEPNAGTGTDDIMIWRVGPNLEF